MNSRPSLCRAARNVLLRIAIPAVLMLICLPSPARASGPERIVSLGPNLTEILFDLGLGDRVAGVTRFCDWPPATRSKPEVGGYTNPSLEAIVALRPDLVVMTDEGTPRGIHDRLVRLGIPVCVFRARRLAELPGALREFGAAVGAGRAAETRAATLEKALRHFAARARVRSGDIRTGLFIIQPEPLMVAGPGTVVDDAMTVLGLRNIAAGTGLPYPKLSVEEVFRRSPDVIFIGRGSMTDASASSLLKQWKGLPAVRKGRVYVVGETLYRLSPRLLEGMEEMDRLLERGGGNAGKR
jgi:iron complex transport system substrate-binding protein